MKYDTPTVKLIDLTFDFVKFDDEKKLLIFKKDHEEGCIAKTQTTFIICSYSDYQIMHDFDGEEVKQDLGYVIQAVEDLKKELEEKNL